MKEYIYEDKLTFVIDEDGDSFEIFQKAMEIINNLIIPFKSEFKNGYWDESKGYFLKDNITVYLEYSNWTGTVLRVSSQLAEEEIQKVRQWAEEIYRNCNILR